MVRMPTAKHLTALAYVRAGIPVFPCRVDGKEPAIFEGFKSRQATEKFVNLWWGHGNDWNIGRVPEDIGECGIDVDTRNGANETLDKLNAEGCVFGNTRRVRTPSQGYHLFYRGSLKASVGKLGKGIDTRGRVSYVLVPPSYVVEREKGYEGAYVDETPGMKAAPLPLWIAERINTVDVPAREAAPGTQFDTEFAIAECRRELQRMESAVQGNASNVLFEQACYLKDRAISGQMAITLLKERHPAYEEWDIAQRVHNAWTHGQNQPGCDRPISHEEAFAGVIPPEPIVDGGFRGRDWRTDPARNYKPLEWLWDKLLPEGFPAIVTGDAKIGKTTFMQNFALHIANGQSFLGADCRRRDVLMLLGEDMDREINANLEAIGAKLRMNSERVFTRSVVSEPYRPQGHRLALIADNGRVEEQAFLREVVIPAIMAHPGCVIIIDPLIEFFSMNRFAEAVPRGLINLLNAIRDLGCTPIVTDHPTQNSMDNDRDVGGSKQMEASFPTVATIKAKPWEHSGAQRPMTFELKYARYSQISRINFFRFRDDPTYSTSAAQGYSLEDIQRKIYLWVVEGCAMSPRRILVTRGAKNVYKEACPALFFEPTDAAEWFGLELAEFNAHLASLEKRQWLQFLSGNRPVCPVPGIDKYPAHYEPHQSGYPRPKEIAGWGTLPYQPPAKIDWASRVW